MKTEKYWFLVVVVSVFALQLWAEKLVPDKPKKIERPKFSAKVQIDVSADKEIENQVYSFVSREFRSLSDVTIVNKKPEYILNIIAMQVKATDGHITGFAISSVVEKPLYSEELLNWKRNKEDLDLDEYFANSFTVNCSPKNHQLSIGGSTDLQNMCKKIIADFDVCVLEQDRKIHQKLYDIVDKASKKILEQIKLKEDNK